MADNEIAFQVVKQSFMKPVAQAYFFGRGMTRANEDFKLDDLMIDASSTTYATAGYAEVYPYSASLDKFVGFTAGFAATPVAFLFGMVYYSNQKI